MDKYNEINAAVMPHVLTSDNDNNPAVYVGTYAKYNDGNLYGAWLDLTTFADYDEFAEVCRQLHADEEDPEIMYQDYQCFPGSLYCESCLKEDTFGKIIDYANLDEDDKEAFRDYLDMSGDYDIDAFRDAYQGQFGSEEDFAAHIVRECYDLDNMMGSLANYFDYKAFARDLFLDYHMGYHGHVFYLG